MFSLILYMLPFFKIQKIYIGSVYAGASSGIGAATAKLFSRLGASVALTGRNVENLQAVGKECNQV